MRTARDGILRIIDANLNRSREGLRVCEEVTRFILDSGPITKRLKDIRHRITQTMKRMPSKPARLVDYRDSPSDVLRSSGTRSELRRADPAEIFAANMQRVKESLRVLEEFAKLSDKSSAIAFQRLRFAAYDVEAQALRSFGRSRGPISKRRGKMTDCYSHITKRDHR